MNYINKLTKTQVVYGCIDLFGWGDDDFFNYYDDKPYTKNEILEILTVKQKQDLIQYSS